MSGSSISSIIRSLTHGPLYRRWIASIQDGSSARYHHIGSTHIPWWVNSVRVSEECYNERSWPPYWDVGIVLLHITEWASPPNTINHRWLERFNSFLKRWTLRMIVRCSFPTTVERNRVVAEGWMHPCYGLKKLLAHIKRRRAAFVEGDLVVGIG